MSNEITDLAVLKAQLTDVLDLQLPNGGLTKYQGYVALADELNMPKILRRLGKQVLQLNWQTLDR